MKQENVENNGKLCPGNRASFNGAGGMQEDVPQRRLVLRGALAIGGGFCLPIILSACDTRKEGDPGSVAPTSPPAVAPTSAPATPPVSAPDSSANMATPPAVAKAPQASVQYQAQPKGDQKCSNCLHFVAESNTCKLVDGQISPEGWCVLWMKMA